MSISSLRQGNAARVCGYAVAAAIVVGVGANCGGSPTREPTTTTTIPALTGSITVQNLPCVAPGSGPITCTFAGSASGGQAPHTFNWRFTNPANNQIIDVNNQQQARPELGCGFSTGVVTFNLAVALTVTPASGAATTTSTTQQIARQAGACGT